MLRALISPVFVKTKEGFMPQVTRINVDVLKKPSKSEQSKRGSVSKMSQKTFKGYLSVPDGMFSWNDFVKARNKSDFVKKKLDHFYTFSEEAEMERNLSLTVQINGVTRTLNIKEVLEFSMGIDVTNKLKFEPDGRPQKHSFKKEAVDVVKFIAES